MVHIYMAVFLAFGTPAQEVVMTQKSQVTYGTVEECMAFVEAVAVQSLMDYEKRDHVIYMFDKDTNQTIVANCQVEQGPATVDLVPNDMDPTEID